MVMRQLFGWCMAVVAVGMPLPWTVPLEVTRPLTNGSSVAIAQGLLNRAGTTSVTLSVDGVYGDATAAAVGAFRGDGNTTFDDATATRLLACCSDDGFDGSLPLNTRAKYAISMPVSRNRSVELNATLLDGGGQPLFSFRTRAHGIRDDGAPRPWPDYSSDVGLNVFSSNGNTPTGLATLDLNSPEPNATLYGPYPINRIVAGLAGNAALVLGPGERSGLLVHTGDWPSGHSDMPNSDGCIHAHPDDIERIWHILVHDLGVHVRDNPFTSVNYPYQPQGIIAIYQVD